MLKSHGKIASLDIGSFEIKLIISELDENGALSVVGVGTSKSCGVRKGVIINIDTVINSIKEASKNAIEMAGVSINSVNVTISGNHISGINSSGVVAIKNNLISKRDIEKVNETSKAIPLNSDKEILHSIEQDYTINGQAGVKNPIGMPGVRLELNSHIVTGSSSCIQNIIKAVRRAGLSVDSLTVSAIASSDCLLTSEEKEQGVCLLDIGAGTTDIAVYSESSLKFISVLPLAGNNITSDLAACLTIPVLTAENLKVTDGIAFRALASKDKVIQIDLSNQRSGEVVSADISEVIEGRVLEIFTLISQLLIENGLNSNISSIVLTGGSSKLYGIQECAENVFKLPTRSAEPRLNSGLFEIVNSAEFSSSIGILSYSLNSERVKKIASNSVLSKFKTIISDYF